MMSISHSPDSTKNILVGQSVETTKPNVQNVENKTSIVTLISRSEGVCIIDSNVIFEINFSNLNIFIAWTSNSRVLIRFIRNCYQTCYKN